MAYIYIIKNRINNKVYIGQTVQTLRHRWHGHMYQYNIGNNSKLYKAMRLLGINNFKMELLEECEYTVLNDKEKYYIEKFDSFNNGYNSTLGGDALSPRLMKYALEIIGLYNSGLSSSEIAKQYSCSDETVLNILKREDVPIRKLSKPVLVIDFEEVFDSYYATARFLIENGLSQSKSVRDVAQNISNACNTMTEAYGIRFAHLEDVHSGAYKYNKFKDKSKHINTKTCHCRMCSKPITSKSKSGMCNSCANVSSRGLIPKPSKEQLVKDLDTLNLEQISKKYERTKSTVCTWIKSYGIK